MLAISSSISLHLASMAAVMDAPVGVAETVSARDYSHLKRYQFQPGNTISKTGGRPKGMLNASTVLLKSAPRLARSYVKEGAKGNATILVDARKWILPVEDDSSATGNSVVIVIAEAAAPRLLSVPADSSPSALPAPSSPAIDVRVNDQRR